MNIERNQVWKFDGTLWRVTRVESDEVELVELLGERTMTALTIWLLASSEWQHVYTHRLAKALIEKAKQEP